MQIGDIVEPVESPVVYVRIVLGPGCDRLVGEQVEVDVRAQLPDPFPTFDPVVRAIGGNHVIVGPQQCVHQRQPVPGPKWQVVPDDCGLYLAVECDRGDRVLDTRGEQDFGLDVVRRNVQCPKVLGQRVGRRCGRIIGDQHGVELLLLGLGHQFLLGQRRRSIEKCCAVTIFTQQTDRQGDLFFEPHRGLAFQVCAKICQVLCARIKPIPFVGADAVHQPPHFRHVVGDVHPGQVDLGEVTARVVEQVPRINTCV